MFLFQHSKCLSAQPELHVRDKNLKKSTLPKRVADRATGGAEGSLFCMSLKQGLPAWLGHQPGTTQGRDHPQLLRTCHLHGKCPSTTEWEQHYRKRSGSIWRVTSLAFFSSGFFLP